VSGSLPCLIHAPDIPYEEEVVRRWWVLPLKSWLPLDTGGFYQLLFAGRPGGAAGPDVRDAVFGAARSVGEMQRRDLERRVGDVEFHVRASDWVTHHHDSDPRYNNVILHVVLVCDDPRPTTRQDGVTIPVCSLYDLSTFAPPAACIAVERDRWPCQETGLPAEARDRLLIQAGLQRFEQKAHAFVELLHASSTDSNGQTGNRRLVINHWDSYDLCLVPALAEGLGYGRDRAFFRSAGIRLLGRVGSIPEPAGRSLQPAPLDAERLRVLARLVREWRQPGIWQTLRLRLAAPVSYSNMDILQAVRRDFGVLGLSLARTDILVINIVLPFTLAVALLEGDTELAERAQVLYREHPGLCSNRITRGMCAQLQLGEEPEGSCRQQGLHYIYQETCREKRCEMCMMSARNI